MSELIHNSTHHQNLDKVSVMVHFARIRDLVRFPTLPWHGMHNGGHWRFPAQ